MAEIPLEGFAYDSQRASAVATGLEATLAIARSTGARTPDLLAGLGLAVALVIVQSKIQRSPESAARSLADFIVANVRSLGTGPRQGS